jgi:hypothetical protein
VEEILRQNKDGLAFLNTDDRNWLRNETWSLLKDTLFGKAPGRRRSLIKMGFSLLVLKTYDMKTTTLTSFLDAAKNHKLIFDPKIQSKTIEVLENLAKSADTLCETLRQSLIEYFATPIIIPDFTKKEDIKLAVKRSFNFFIDWFLILHFI